MGMEWIDDDVMGWVGITELVRKFVFSRLIIRLSNSWKLYEKGRKYDDNQLEGFNQTALQHAPTSIGLDLCNITGDCWEMIFFQAI